MECLFEDIITSDDGFERKPSTEMFEEMIQRNSLRWKQTISIGDRRLDLIPAKKLGMATGYIGENKIEDCDINMKCLKEFYKYYCSTM